MEEGSFKLTWLDQQNLFRLVGSQNSDHLQLPDQADLVMKSIQNEGGLKRTKGVYILSFSVLIFLVLSLLAGYLYSLKQRLLAAIIILICPFLSYVFVAWWSLNTNRLGKVNKFLKEKEKTFGQILLQANLTMNVFFVRGNGYLFR